MQHRFFKKKYYHFGGKKQCRTSNILVRRLNRRDVDMNYSERRLTNASSHEVKDTISSSEDWPLSPIRMNVDAAQETLNTSSTTTSMQLTSALGKRPRGVPVIVIQPHEL
jgi:hypothetical protein